MRIESNDRKSYLNIEYVDSEIERYPSVCVVITVQDGDFRGYNKDVWIELDLLKNYIENLKILDKTRRGAASMNSMSPEEFQIKIETYDLSGHMILNYKISQYAHRMPNTNIISLTGAFELDVSLFTNIISEFGHLANEKNYPLPKYPFIKE
jgi:hypothetical protein